MSVTLLKAGQHSCVGQLSQPTEPIPGDNRTQLDKPAMLVYCGKFQSMDGEVEITEAHIDRMMNSHNERLDKQVKLGKKESEYFTKMPPVQLDHSTSARDTIGRAVGTLSKGMFNNDDGIPVPCLLCSRLVILGKQNVEHVMDGRWAHLSIGADLENGLLNEISVTPFPAAAHATMLAAKRLNDWKTYSKGMYKGFPYQIETDDNAFYGYADTVEFRGIDAAKVLEMIKAHIDRKPPKISKLEGEYMHEKMKKHLMEHEKMSEKEADEHLKKMKDHLSKKLGKDDKEVTEHMSKMSEEDGKRLADDVKEEEKKLAAEKEKDKLKAETDADREGDALKKKLSAAKPKMIALAKAMKAGISTGNAKAKEGGISAKISRLRAAAKMTPAEQKKINLTELATKSEAELKAYFQGFEERENVIDPRIFGTTKALSLASLSRLSERTRKIRLEAEIRQDMGRPLTDEHKAELKNSQDSVRMGLPEGTMEKEDHDEMMKHLHKMLSSYDQRDAVLEHIKKMMEMKHMSEEPSAHAEESEKQMSALAENYNRLQTEFQDFVRLVGETVGIHSAELE